MDAFFRLTPLPSEGHTIDLSNPLDMLYLNGDKTELEKALKLFRKNGGLKRYRLAQSDNVQKVLDEIASLNPGKISPILYESYSENLRKAVDQVFKKDSGTILSDLLRANVTRFAANKALNATREVQQKLGEGIDEAKRVIRTYNRYQATEYNTTVSRSRTAKQFEQFNTPDSLRLFPNLRWLPSRSVNPREQHTLFYNLVWAKNDDFWNENTPGSLWNCKCDWEETNDPVTKGNPQGNKSAEGLCGNPAKTGEVFTTIESENKNVGYKAHPYLSNTDWTNVKNNVRDFTRSSHDSFVKEYTSDELGKVLIDDITYIEASKGSLNESSYFFKLEVLNAIERYSNRLIYLRSEDIDLSHNNRNNIFYRRKASFSSMEVYQLNIDDFVFIVKFGKFRLDGTLHLYSITG